MSPWSADKHHNRVIGPFWVGSLSNSMSEWPSSWMPVVNTEQFPDGTRPWVCVALFSLDQKYVPNFILPENLSLLTADPAR